MDEKLIEFPVLGEPFPIELANTRYRDGDNIVDFVETQLLFEAWLLASPTPGKRKRPARWNRESHLALLAVRDSVAMLINAAVDHRVPDAASITSINHAAQGCRFVTELRWSREGPSSIDHVHGKSAFDIFVGQIAIETIELLSGPNAAALQRCQSEDCWMLFLKNHPRRRWCHNSCGHRNRQANCYYRARGLRYPERSDHNASTR